MTRDTRDQEFAAKRQLFLTEQGYRYTIMDAHDVPAYQPVTMEGTAVVREPLALPPPQP